VKKDTKEAVAGNLCSRSNHGGWERGQSVCGRLNEKHGDRTIHTVAAEVFKALEGLARMP